MASIARYIALYAICVCLSLMVHSCRSVRHTEEYNHIGTEQITKADSTSRIERDTFWSESLDTSVVEVFKTIVTYDTERTDSDGTHPIKQVEQMQAVKHTAKVSRQTDTKEKSEESITTEDIAVVDSTATHSVRVASRPWYSLVWTIVFSVAVIAIMYWLSKKLSNYLDRYE